MPLRLAEPGTAPQVLVQVVTTAPLAATAAQLLLSSAAAAAAELISLLGYNVFQLANVPNVLV